MTLEQGYFITQIIAGIVVVGSILFLAVQVRQNNLLLERTMIEDFHKLENELFDKISDSREFAEFHIKAGQNYDELDEIDKYRSEHLARKNLRMIMRSVNARLHGRINDEDWKEIELRLRNIANRKNMRAVWSRIKGGHPVAVQEFVENLWAGAAQT